MEKVTCKKCILDSETPGVAIHAETGLCQFCGEFTPLSAEKKAEFRVRMDNLLNSPPSPGTYDVIFALSGGIDSSYALYRLKKDYPALRVLAVQFDNGFISETALENAKRFCELTGSTWLHLTLEQDALNDTFFRAARSTNAFPASARYRASDICNVCISIVKQKIIGLALSTGAPYIVFAFSPGQTDAPFIPLTRAFLAWMRKLFDDSLKAMGITERDTYLIDADLIKSGSPASPVTIIHPFLVWDYDKPAFKKEIVRLGWKDPELQDHNSSNCLLNAYAIKNHLDKYHIHSYAYDMAALVRQGCMSREEAFKKLNAEFPDALIRQVDEKLNPNQMPAKNR